MPDATFSLDEQDEIKELAIRWLLDSDYVVRVVEGTMQAQGHVIRKQTTEWGLGHPNATVSMEVQLRRDTGNAEAQKLIDLITSLTGQPVSFSTEMNDHGNGFAPEPNRLSFEMVVPSRKKAALHRAMQLKYRL